MAHGRTHLKQTREVAPRPTTVKWSVWGVAASGYLWISMMSIDIYGGHGCVDIYECMDIYGCMDTSGCMVWALLPYIQFFFCHRWDLCVVMHL